MTVHAYTSFTYSYLNRARVLARTLRRHHPDWIFWAILTDKEPEDFAPDWEAEDFDRVVTSEELFGEETRSWLFGHDIVEACTAVKGKALQRILNEPGCEMALYFDPDIAIFNPVAPALDALRDHSIVLTPHQVDPEDAADLQAIRDNEVTTLDYGTFNLGFVGVKNDAEGRRFADWWAERLHDWCHDRLDIGIFVDQKWCNLVPCFFDGVKIARDPGLNVASWNLSKRRVSFSDEGNILVNGVPLRFYHFTKLGPVGAAMTERYAKGNLGVIEIWWWYKSQVDRATDPRIPAKWWHYGTFADGTEIPKRARELYRERPDLKAAYADPFASGPGTFQEWLRRN